MDRVRGRRVREVQGEEAAASGTDQLGRPPSDESEHFRQSLAARMSPANLHGALLMMLCDGELEECHMSSLSLRDWRVALTVLEQRIHGLDYSSGFITCTPHHKSQYRKTSRNFIVETQIANWARKSFDGATIFNNFHDAVPCLLNNLEQVFSADVAAAMRPHLQEIVADARLMPARAVGKMDPWTLVNILDLTKSRAVWKRLWGSGNLEEAQRKVEKARARAERDGDVEKLQQVLPLGEDWTNEGKRRQRGAPLARIVIAAATSPVSASISRSRVVTGKTVAEYQRGGEKARGSWSGVVFLNNLTDAVHSVIAQLPTLFAHAATAAVAQQIEEIVNDPTLLVERASMDRLTFVNSVNLTESRIVWKRLLWPGDLERLAEKLKVAGARAERWGGIVMKGVVPKEGREV